MPDRSEGNSWFERLTGFPERSYGETKSRLRFGATTLANSRTGREYATGTLLLPSVAELRDQVRTIPPGGRPKLSVVEGDVRELHRHPANAGALFQVASQFNMLEMVDPSVTPEDGVTRYERDFTQGPACAMAAGAATIYRNYLVSVNGEFGQTASRQLNGLADLGKALSSGTGLPVERLWSMQNGYALPTQTGLQAISTYISSLDETALDELRGHLRLGLHRDVETTEGEGRGQFVSQIFCSALPVAYSDLSGDRWKPFASLVLEAAYEGTALAGILNLARGSSNRILLTRLGGGAFGNDDDWIDKAILRALWVARDHALDVRIVSRGKPSRELIDLVARSGFATAPIELDPWDGIDD